jgi:glycosyltransferase involved in cell wall biosynthesis
MAEETSPKKVPWPSIAIVTPSFNQSQFLPACIASVLDQDYTGLQYAIVDGGSTDGSVEIIKSKAGSLHYWRSHPDEGPYAAIAEGFAKTHAGILGWINSDDILLPWALRVVGGIFRDCPEVEWITTETPMNIDTDGLPRLGRFCGGPIPGFNMAGFQHRENLAVPGSPPGAQFIQQESTFWRRSLWDKAGAKFDNRFKFAGDFELWDRFFEYAQLFSVNLPLGAFRRHDARQRSIGNFAQYIAECEKVLSRHIDTSPDQRPLLARRAMRIALKLQDLEHLRKPVYIVRQRVDGRYFAKELEWSDI